MKQLLKNFYYWYLDYLYVARKEVRSVVSRSRAERYHTDGGQPIILIPGVYENWKIMEPIARMLKAHRYDVHVVNGLGFNRGTIEEMAKVVETYISGHDLAHVLLIAHSKGGLVGKYLMMTENAAQKIDGMIALNTPFAGSPYAYMLPSKSLRIFIPKSKILSSLALNTVINSRIVSIYGIFDPHIPGGSELEGARNVQLRTYGHFRVLKSREVHQAILDCIADENHIFTGQKLAANMRLK